jgi:hypothetical protein
MRAFKTGLVLSGVLSIAGVASAQEPPTPEKEFGNPGTLNIGAATGLDFQYKSTSPPQGSSTSEIGFTVVPQMAYFVIEGLSVGGQAIFSYTKPKDSDGLTVLGIGPTVGYNVWLKPELLSLWPQVGVVYNSASITITSTTPGTNTTTTATASKFSLVAFVPLLIHPVKHFHFGVGPYFSADLSSSVSLSGSSTDGSKDVTLGLRGEIAGWL